MPVLDGLASLPRKPVPVYQHFMIHRRDAEGAEVLGFRGWELGKSSSKFKVEKPKSSQAIRARHWEWSRFLTQL